MNGASLRAIRIRCGLTLEQFGHRVGVNGRTLSRWELDDRDVYEDVAAEANALFDQYLAIREHIADERNVPGITPEVPVLIYRPKDNPPEPYDRLLWNAAATDYALDEDVDLEWAGYDREDEEAAA